MHTDPLKQVEKLSGQLNRGIDKYRKPVFSRFPLLFVLLSTLGLVATLYGFEKVIDSIPLFAEHPWLLLLAGVAILIFTGSLYKKLS